MRISAESWSALIRGERRGPLAILARAGLSAASWPYGVAVWWRNRQYDRGHRTIRRVSVPVVSVGNLTLGGTGKTPCVEYVARYYRDHDIRVAILSRGYGSDRGRNDEAMVLEENLPDVPHYQNADRIAAAELAIEESESELLVLDDGFQHRRLHRDLDIVLIDATSPPHHDRLFPRGTLREPVTGLRRAGAILLTRCDQVSPASLDQTRDWLTRHFPDTAVASSEHRPVELFRAGEPVEVRTPDHLRRQAVAGFCGIGNPTAFRRTLESLGATVVAFRCFPDHHPYSRQDVDDLRNWANSLPGDALIATTQKDWVKLRLRELAARQLWAVRIGLTFRDGQHAFDSALRAVVPDDRIDTSN